MTRGSSNSACVLVQKRPRKNLMEGNFPREFYICENVQIKLWLVVRPLGFPIPGGTQYQHWGLKVEFPVEKVEVVN